MRISDWSSDVCSSDLSKVTAGQFIETEDGARVFFAEEPTKPGEEMGNVIARVIDPEWHSVITAESARIQTEKNGDRFLVLSQGNRYDLKPRSEENTSELQSLMRISYAVFCLKKT